MVLSRRATLAKHANVYRATYAIMFFGTPHGGANGANMLASVLNIAKIVGSDNSSLAKNLENNSEHLWELNRSYLPLSTDIRHVFFAEAYTTPIFGGPAIMVSQIILRYETMTKVTFK